jgi:hypothetical protein
MESGSMPVLLLYAPEGGVTTEKQAQAYGRDDVVAVPGGHMVMWSASIRPLPPRSSSSLDWASVRSPAVRGKA